MPEWVYLANWTPERKTINPARNKPARWAFWQELPDCAKDRIENWNAYRSWVERWPKHCDVCLGAGEHHWTENAAPLGSGENWQMPMSDVCDNCVGAWDMVCARCGEEIHAAILDRDRVDETAADGDIIEQWHELKSPCPLCGWAWGENNDDSAPLLMEQCACDYKIKDRRKPGKWQLLVFGIFRERFQSLFKHPIWIMRGRDWYNVR